MGKEDPKPISTKVTAAMKDTVSYLQKSVKNLARFHHMKEPMKQAARMRDQLEKKEWDALERLITAHSQVHQAVHFSRVAVRTCKSIVETVRRVITAEKGKISDKLKSAIHIYVKRVGELMPQLEKARDELAKTQVVLEKAMKGFEIFKEWCSLKISEMEGKTDLEVVNQWAIAYAGAPGATVGVADVVLGAVAFGGAAVVAVGRATVVTEGKTVGELRKKYGHGIESINEATKSFKRVLEINEESVVELERKKKQLGDIVAMAEHCDANGELTCDEVKYSGNFILSKEDVLEEYGHGIESLNEANKSFEKMLEITEESVVELEMKKIHLGEIVAVAQQSAVIGEVTCDEDKCVGMFDIFRDDVFELEQLCNDYLNAPDMPKDHQEEQTKA